MQSNGKELCDLLIVFDKHIIIFQTKTVRMETPVMHLLIGEDGTKSNSKSAEQLIGAKTGYCITQIESQLMLSALKNFHWK